MSSSIEYYQRAVQPPNTYGLVDYQTDSRLDGQPFSFKFIVTICVEYNSRFPRHIPKTIKPGTSAAPGGQNEIPLEPGQITVCDTSRFQLGYHNGAKGVRPTRDDVPEGKEGGIALVLSY